MIKDYRERRGKSGNRKNNHESQGKSSRISIVFREIFYRTSESLNHTLLLDNGNDGFASSNIRAFLVCVAEL